MQIILPTTRLKNCFSLRSLLLLFCSCALLVSFSNSFLFLDQQLGLPAAYVRRQLEAVVDADADNFAHKAEEDKTRDELVLTVLDKHKHSDDKHHEFTFQEQTDSASKDETDSTDRDHRDAAVNSDSHQELFVNEQQLLSVMSNSEHKDSAVKDTDAVIESNSSSVLKQNNSAVKESAANLAVSNSPDNALNQAEISQKLASKPETTNIEGMHGMKLYNDEYESTEDDIPAVMKARTKHMKQVCSKYGLDAIKDDPIHSPNPWEYIVNKEYKLAWCNVFKSASSSWMYIFNILAGYTKTFLDRTKNVPLQMARDKYGRPSLFDLLSTIEEAGSVSFIVGRNPFERLVSGYRDKIQNALPSSVHDKLRRKITERYRRIKIPARPRILSAVFIPSFKEFVRFVVQDNKAGRELDMHWSPVYSFCTPCMFNLSDIILFDTQDRDTQYLLQKAKIDKKVDYVRKNPTKGSTHNLTDSFLATLPANLFNDLVDLYRIDFELFNYRVPKFSDYNKQR